MEEIAAPNISPSCPCFSNSSLVVLEDEEEEEEEREEDDDDDVVGLDDFLPLF